MTQFLRFLFAIVFLVGGLSGYGQLRPGDLQPGVLYLKIKNESNLVLPAVDEILDREYPAEWVSLIENYGITELTRSLKPLKTPVFDRVYRLRFDGWEKNEDLFSKISSLPYVEYVEYLPYYQASLIPNDSLWSQQSNALELIGAPEAWDLHTGGNAVVAVVDNAIELDHPDLLPNLWTNTGEIPNNGIDDDNNGYIDDIHGWDAADLDENTTPPANNGNPFYTTFTHGTHVAGLAAVATDNNIGIASIGHSTKVMAVKVTFDNAPFPLAIQTPLEGVAYAIANNADVINMSFGGPGGFGAILDSLMQEALRRDIILVAAAGNDGSTNESFPAALDGVLSVVMTDDQDLVNPLSNYGNWADICAPGTQRLSSTSFGSYERQTGTSMASPTVAGLLALMKSYQPGLPKDVYEYVMLQTALDIDSLNPSYIGLLGHGRIQAFEALQTLAACFPLADSSEGPRIDSVQIGSYFRVSPDPCARYSFDRSSTNFLPNDQAINLEMDILSCVRTQDRQVAVFVDWNADGDFDDSLERAFELPLFSGDSSISTSIGIPAFAVLETETRLRIITREGAGSIDPCADYSYGETEDHLILFIEPVCANSSLTIQDFPYEVDFEDFALCSPDFATPCALGGGWTNASDDDLEWIAFQGPTPTTNTGPGVDFLPATATGTYLYVETPDSVADLQAVLNSPCLDLTELSDPVITFAYHMFGLEVGSLILEVRAQGPWEEVWRSEGNRQNTWRTETINLSQLAGGIAQIRFVTLSAVGERGDIALGFVNVGERFACTGEEIRRETAGSVEDGSGLIRRHAANADCRWLIQPYNARQITIGFERFRTIQDQDVLRAFDGEDNTFPELRAYSGFGADSLVVLGGSVYLQFESDDLGEQDGWLLNYETEPLPSILGYQLEDITGPNGDTLLLPLQVENFSKIFQAGGILSLADSSIARFAGMELNTGLSGNLAVNYTGDTLSFNWEGSDQSLSNGDTLAWIKLFLAGQKGESTELYMGTAEPGTYEARKRIGLNNLSLMLPTGDSALVTLGAATQIVAPEEFAWSWTNSPNPFDLSTQLRFNLSEPRPAVFTVYDPVGRVIWTRAIAATSIDQPLSLETRHWPEGVYVGELTVDGESYRRKLWLRRE